jgi:hypothetical protein
MGSLKQLFLDLLGLFFIFYLFIYLFYHNGKFEICGYFGSDDKEKKKINWHYVFFVIKELMQNTL